MKILLVHSSYREVGGEDVVFSQERQLLESAGHEVATYCRSNQETVTRSFLKRGRYGAQAVWSGRSHREVGDLVRKFRPDVVHVHNTFLVISPSIYSACKEEGVAVVQTLHNYRLLCPAANFFRDGHVCEDCTSHGVWYGVRHGCYRGSRTATALAASMLTYHRLRKTWLTDIDCYIALSEFARAKFVDSGIPAEKIRVKPNFLHPDPGVSYQREDWVLCVGRISTEKGVDTVLRAWKQLSERIPLKMIGEGPRLEATISAVSREGLPIRLEGRVSHDCVLEAMKRARFLIFPSQLYENFPMTILEAYASGIPVIASGMPSIREIVKDGVTGLLFRPGDDRDLAQKVEWAWGHRAEMDQLAKNARAEFRAKYTAQQNYRALMNIYEWALGHSSLAAA